MPLHRINNLKRKQIYAKTADSSMIPPENPESLLIIDIENSKYNPNRWPHQEPVVEDWIKNILRT